VRLSQRSVLRQRQRSNGCHRDCISAVCSLTGGGVMATSLWGRPDRQSEPGDDRGSIGNALPKPDGFRRARACRTAFRSAIIQRLYDCGYHSRISCPPFCTRHLQHAQLFAYRRSGDDAKLTPCERPTGCFRIERHLFGTVSATPRCQSTRPKERDDSEADPHPASTSSSCLSTS
jgi:hypothetical protein